MYTYMYICTHVSVNIYSYATLAKSFYVLSLITQITSFFEILKKTFIKIILTMTQNLFSSIFQLFLKISNGFSNVN